MELQINAAATLLPLKTERPAPPLKRDDAGSRFKEYFDGAQTAKASERPQPADKPAPPEELKAEQPAEVKDEGAEVSASTEIAPVVVVAAQVEVEPPAPTGDTPIPLEEGEAKSETPVGGILFRSGRPSNSNAQGTSITTPVLPVDEKQPLPLPDVQSAAITNTSGDTSSQRGRPVGSAAANTSSITGDAGEATATTESTSPQIATAASVTQTKSSQLTGESKAATEAAVPTAESEPVVGQPEKSAASGNKEGEAHQDAARDQPASTANKLKAKNLDPRFDVRRLEGDPNRDTQPPSNSAWRIKPKAEASDVAIRNIDIKSGHGDSAAASIGRFLISGATESTTANTTALDAPPISNNATLVARHSGTPSATPSSQTLSQLMNPAATASDAVDAAAKVLSASSNGGRQQVTLQLDPPELGQLKLQIRMHQDAMTLRVDANSQAVAKLIESRLGELKDALATHGIRVDRSEVVVSRPAAFDNQPQQQNSEQQSSNTQQQSTFDESRSSWAESGRFGGTQQGGPNGQENQGDSGSAPEFESPLAGTAWSDANESTAVSEMWIDLVA